MKSTLKTIALLIRPDTSYGRDVIRGVGQFARDQTWSVHILPPDVTLLNALNHSRPHGIISHIPEEQRLKARTVPPDIPTVNVSQYPSGQTPAVMPDNWRIGRMAAEHLIERGLRRFYFIADGQHYPLLQRLQGFRDTLEEKGHACESLWCRPYADSTWRHQAAWDQTLVQLLSRPGPTIGILAGSDGTAAQLLRACRHGELNVPEKICVVGVHDDPMIVALTRPFLSSVRTGCDRVGVEAARLLAALLAGEHPPSEPLLIAPLEVVVRGSSDVFAVEDALVRDALTALRQRATGNFDVNLLAQQLRVSRRTLDRRFSSQLGRTPADELRRLRLEMAKGLLRETSLPVEDVACSCGYASATRLGEAMRKRFDTTPALYRRHAKTDRL